VKNVDEIKRDQVIDALVKEIKEDESQRELRDLKNIIPFDMQKSLF
jgi:hypothetical protein